MIPPGHAEGIEDFADLGVVAFTTTRAFGSLSGASTEPAAAVTGRWAALRDAAAALGVQRLAVADQVHGARVLVHDGHWHGVLRSPGADGHFAPEPGTALAVSIADCVPVFIAHPSGAVALLHSGWRGTAARIVASGVREFTARGIPASELRIHLGPAICGSCYAVSADVARQVLGNEAPATGTIDLRAAIADHARALGARHVSISRLCTKCDNDRFFSHRAGDAGRQVAVIMASPRGKTAQT